jgi:hypothetical protein
MDEQEQSYDSESAAKNEEHFRGESSQSQLSYGSESDQNERESYDEEDGEISQKESVSKSERGESYEDKQALETSEPRYFNHLKDKHEQRQSFSHREMSESVELLHTD